MKTLQLITYSLAIVAYLIIILYYSGGVGIGIVIVLFTILAVLIPLIKSNALKIIGSIVLIILVAIGWFVIPEKSKVYELTWSNVVGKNIPPIPDIAIDTRKAQSVSIAAESLNKDNDKSKNMNFIVLACPKKEGNYQEYFTINMNNNEFRTVGVTPYAGFLKIRLTVNDSREADIKVLISVVN